MAWFEEAAWNVSSGAEGGRTGLSVQCSAGGICDESTGNCTCRNGVFAGDACGVMDCPTCSDVGECQDMEFFASVSGPNIVRAEGDILVLLGSGSRFVPEEMLIQVVPGCKKRVHFPRGKGPEKG